MSGKNFWEALLLTGAILSSGLALSEEVKNLTDEQKEEVCQILFNNEPSIKVLEKMWCIETDPYTLFRYSLASSWVSLSPIDYSTQTK